MCLLPKSCKTDVYIRSYSAFQCFSYAWICPWIQFSSNNRAIFLPDFKYNFTVEFMNFSISDRIDEMNFWNPKFLSCLGFPHLRLITPCGLRPPKGTPSKYSISTIPLVCRKIFPVCCVQNTWNYAVVWLWLCPR